MDIWRKYMKKLRVILCLICVFIFVSCNNKQEADTEFTDKNVILTLEERKNIFASYFNQSQYNVADIKQNLDKIDRPQVLTLDEALNVFWKESGQSVKDYLCKTDTNGQVYYQHKTSDNMVSVFVNLLYEDLQYGDVDSANPESYGFLIIQTKGQNYLVTISGKVSTIQ